MEVRYLCGKAWHIDWRFRADYLHAHKRQKTQAGVQHITSDINGATHITAPLAFRQGLEWGLGQVGIGIAVGVGFGLQLLSTWLRR